MNIQTSKKPLLIDSHCHLHSIDLSDFNGSMVDVLNEAKEAGINKMLCVCIEFGDMPALTELADRHSELYISAGLHPNSETVMLPNEDYLENLASHSSCIAMGETGLDYYRTENDKSKSVQRDWFRAHIRVSEKLQKPLIIHTRAASQDTIDVMKDEHAENAGGVIHCFTESWEMAKKALDLGFYISFSGIITFKNALDLREVVKKVPLERLLIETDSPYLAPVPFRGKQNRPALVRHVAECVAELRQTSVEAIAELTTDNFYNCFKISSQKTA